jgi:tRNA(Ile)-lysidine synthase
MVALDRAVLDSLVSLAGPRPQVLVAYSGGVDSTVLAHALVKQRRKLGSLRLVHVDHGLQAASAAWSKHCARQARAWRVPFESRRADIRRRRGESPEAAARAARYALLAAALRPGEVLVTAQHQDDQAETLLLQLFRGAGVAGLAAMPAFAPFGPGHIVRPLLGLTRLEIEQYARAPRLRWVEDPTNIETQFARNYLRAKVLPLIEKQWFGAVAAIARTAGHMAEADRLLGSLAARDLVKAIDGDGLNVAALRALPRARRNNALRAWIRDRGIEAPTTAQAMEIGATLLSARADANPEFRWMGAVIRRRVGRLTLEVKSQDRVDAAIELISKSWHWESDRECILNRAGDTLELVDDAAGPIDLDSLPSLLEIRARSGGERLRPGPRARNQALKKLIQAARMPIEERTRLPLVFSGNGAGDRLIAAGDRWIDASVAANVKSRRRARLRWKKGTDLFSAARK